MPLSRAESGWGAWPPESAGTPRAGGAISPSPRMRAMQHGRVKAVAEGECQVAGSAPAVGEGQDLIAPAAEGDTLALGAGHGHHPVPGTQRRVREASQDPHPAQRLAQQPAHVSGRLQGQQVVHRAFLGAAGVDEASGEREHRVGQGGP